MERGRGGGVARDEVGALVVERFDKHWGRSLAATGDTAAQIKASVGAALLRFAQGHIGRLRAFAERAEELLRWFEAQRVARFRASSVLLLYDAERGAPLSGADESGAVRLALVDFGSVAIGSLLPDERDENCVHGLRCLVELLRNAT